MIPSDGSAALDSNVLLLYLAATDESLIPLIGVWKRLNTFSQEDARLLLRTLGRFSTLLTTPHVLAETSNFTGQLAEPARSKMLDALSRYVQKADENFLLAQSLILHPAFKLLRLTDCGLLQLPPACTLITTDFHLSNRRNKEGSLVINFNHQL